MNVWIAKIALLLAIAAMIAIRAPYAQRCAKLKVVDSKRGKLEIALLALAWIGSVILPAIWIVTPLVSFADYRLHPAPFLAGVVLSSLGLWLFNRAHEDLSTNWSISLDIREHHHLITSGVYRSIRHPMYASILLQAIGQALFVPNWIVGPFNLSAFLLLLVLRLGPEERMMLEHFGGEYEAYRKASKRLIPGIW